MNFANQARSRLFVILGLLFSLCITAAPALAKGEGVAQSAPTAADGVRVVQDDPDNPIKFSIDSAIATGSISTPDLYIGTVQSYLGDRADGRTPVFGGGFGVHPSDVLIMNDRVGIVLAAGTDDPWGYPGGSILDAGRVMAPSGSTDLKSATFGKDTVLTAQFLFNTWDAWAPSNAGMVYFDLVNYNFETKAIDNVGGMPAVQVTRKFKVPYNLNGVSTPRDLDVISYYSIAPDNDYAYWFDTVQNNGDAFSTQALNEVVISNKGSVGIDTKAVAALSAANTFNFVTDGTGQPTSQFSTTVISPGENTGSDGRTHAFAGFSGARGYRELRFSAADRPYVTGETRTYESYLMIDDQASWQKVFDFWADYKGLDTFNVSGTVADSSGAPAPYPTVIIFRGNTLFGSVVGDAAGNYSIDLPNENTTQTYNLRVEKKGTVPGTPSANFTSATVPAGGVALQTGAEKVPVTFTFKDQNGDPTWGRISVGALPQMIYTGENYYFSDVKPDGSINKGVVTAMVAPGTYSATAWGEGYGFYSYTTNTTTFSRTVTGNTATEPHQTVLINKPLSAPQDWFGVDNHHHGGRMDAFSPPVVSANAQVTAGLEVPSLSDHQFVIDNCPVYNWSRKLGAIGYMPNEEITPSWAHHNMMPLTEYAYDRFRDCDQVNPIINTNTNHQGILDDAHQQGIAIGVNHPNSSYGLFLADDDNTVPGGMSGDFDGIEIQGFGVTTINEAFKFWSAFRSGGTHRGVPVKRPHYIHGSTDIHDSGQGTGSGSQRSYVHVQDGKLKSAADFDKFSLEFTRNQAAGHSFVSSGAFITPTSGKLFGQTYRADQDGTFTADFNVAALNNITDIYVFGSTGTGTSTGGFNGLTNQISRTTYSGADLATSKNFTLDVSGVQGKQWFALAAVTSSGRRAISNPIWVNGPDVPATQTITAVDPIISYPQVPIVGSVVKQPRTAILTTSPWSGFLFADWKLTGGNFNSVAKKNLNYIYTLTFDAPRGFVFDPALQNAKAGVQVSNDGSKSQLIYRVHLKALPGTR